jgi:hypothetical protein
MRNAMRTFVRAMLGLSLCASPALSQSAQRIEGLWKLVSFEVEDVQTKARESVYGEQPWGYMQVTANGKFYAWARTQPLRPVESLWEDVARSIGGSEVIYRAVFYSGTHRIDGDKLIVDVDQATNEGPVGAALFDLSWSEGRTAKGEVRLFHVEIGWEDRDLLRIETLPMDNPNGAGNVIVGKVTWVRASDLEYGTSD